MTSPDATDTPVSGPAPVQTPAPLTIETTTAEVDPARPLPVPAPAEKPADPPNATTTEDVKSPGPTTTEEVREGETQPTTKVAPASILTIDIGGTKVKILATGQTEPRKAPSGK